MSEPVICKQLCHVVCLPLHFSSPNAEAVSLKNIEAKLKGSCWVEGRTPDDSDDDQIWNDLRTYQTQAYFHPFVRRFLFDKSKVKRFHRNDINKISVKLEHWLIPEFVVEAKVKRCELIIFQAHIGILLFEIEPKEELTIQQLQLFLDTFRRIYPPYFDCFGDNPQTWASGHCPVQVDLYNNDKKIGKTGVYRDQTKTAKIAPQFIKPYKDILLSEIISDKRPCYPWAGHWESLLEPFDCTCKNLDDSSIYVQQLGDDRAPTISWIAFNDPTAITAGDWVRLCFADNPGNDPLPYAKAFLADFEEQFCYDRYWYKGTVHGRLVDSTTTPSRITNCGYAFNYVGNFNDKEFFCNEKNGAYVTFRHIYVEMGLVAHFQKAILLSMSQQLTNMIERNPENQIILPKREKVLGFYNQFIEFTNVFWFDEISPQEQGREIFEAWIKQLRTKALHNELRQELKDLLDYTELQAAAETNKKLSTLTVFGFGAAVLSLLAGIFGMNNPDEFGVLVYTMVVFAIILVLIFRLEWKNK